MNTVVRRTNIALTFMWLHEKQAGTVKRSGSLEFRRHVFELWLITIDPHYPVFVVIKKKDVMMHNAYHFEVVQLQRLPSEVTVMNV